MKTFDNLGDFINELEAQGELIRIEKEVSPILDVSKITDIESKKTNGGKALLFTNVVDNGKPTFNIATNLFGSEKRMSMALNVKNFAEAENKIADMMQTQPPKSFGEFFELAKKLLPLVNITPRKWKGCTPPCQEVVKLGEDIDLSEIPVLKCWPHDGGRFVTLPLVFTQSPDGKKKNLGMYRLQIFDKNTTGMHWHIHKDGSHFFREYSKIGKRMPVSVAIGADPATIYAATAPMPRDVYELLLAGFFRGKGVKVTKCITNDLTVPAEAEFVIEGYVDPDERRLEGPFGDHTGYYSLADMYPVFHVTAITRRKKPIYCATLVGPPPMEDCYMAKATERIFLPMLKAVMPEVKDYFLPWEGVFHNICITALDKEYPAHAKKLFSGFWGQGQMSFCKIITAVDSDVNPSDLSAVWQKCIDNFDAKQDWVVTSGVLDALDHSAPNQLMGAKLGIDLTDKITGESPRKSPKLQVANESELSAIKIFAEKEIEAKKVSFFPFFAAFAVDKASRCGRDIINTLAQSKLFEGKFRAVVIFDSDIDIQDKSKMLWKVFNNTDVSRDIIISPASCVFIDACKKTTADGHTREWPDDLSFDK